MILFITGQYAGAQYIHPLITKWSAEKLFKWSIIASGASCNYWNEVNVNYKKISNPIINNVRECLSLFDPTLIITSTSINNNFESLFVIEAKKKSIATASFIDFWSNYLMRFKYNKEIIYPDNIFAIDNRCVEEMLIEGIPNNLIKMIGQPYLEKISKKIIKMGNNLLFAGQPINKFFDKKLGYDEKDFWNICSEVKKRIGTKKIISTRHPEEDFSNYHKNLNLKYLKGKGVKDIEESHTVLGMYSMQMIVGYLCGRKVGSIQPNLSVRDPSPLSRWGLIPRLETVNDVVEFIESKKSLSINQNFTEQLNDRLDQFQLHGSLKRLELFCFRYIN